MKLWIMYNVSLDLKPVMLYRATIFCFYYVFIFYKFDVLWYAFFNFKYNEIVHFQVREIAKRHFVDKIGF